MSELQGPDTLPTFADLFGRPSELAASAPGRVNLIGEHTDYNGGYVLPLAIPQRTRVELARHGRSDRTVAVWSAEAAPAEEPTTYGLGEEARRGDWLDYVQGITDVLGKEGFELGGCDLRISSEVPWGGGLSSSAALEVSLLRAFAEAFSLAIDDVRLALLGQKAENDFVGAPVGIMDQMASSLADTRHALFLDTRSLRFERIPLPREPSWWSSTPPSPTAWRPASTAPGGGSARRRRSASGSPSSATSPPPTCRGSPSSPPRSTAAPGTW